MAKGTNFGSQLQGLMSDSGKRSEKISQKGMNPEFTGLAERDSHYQMVSIYDLEDAPENWNKYPRTKEVSPDTYLETKMSISQHGVLEALRVWEKGDGKYMIISGHNRRDIALELIEDYPEDKEMWEKLPCYVVGKNEKSEIEIRQEINDTNLHRNFNDIDKRTQIAILNDRIELMMGNKTPKGEDIIKLGERMGVKKSMMYNLINIRNNLRPELTELYYEGKIDVNTAVKLCSLNVTVQDYLGNKYEKKLSNKVVKSLPVDVFSKNLSDNSKIELIDEYFEELSNPVKKVKKITFSIPEGLEDEFKLMAEEWLKSRQN